MMRRVLFAGLLLLALAWASDSQEVENVICPGGQSQCPTGDTCCQLASGGYGCCPIPNAVCCDDHVHCCPKSYTCDTSQGTCTQGAVSFPWVKKNVAQPIKVEGIVCPGSTSVCPTGSTCCKISDDKWGCCPVPDAVCCKDGKHCCGKGQKCTGGRCTSSLLSTPWLMKSEAKPMEPKERMPWFTKTLARKFGSIQCDATSACPDDNTCCKLASGEWGCCPIVKAVCCSDGIHCCPGGYTCDVTQGTCQKQAEAVAWSSKTFALPAFVGDVACDATHSCPDGDTCCMLASGDWGCCPYPKAVCCNDKEHCCPQDTTCDISEGKCLKKPQPLGWTTESLALQFGVQCDATHYCPSGNTCCRLASGQWGCCPVPNAVCCNDHQHCCPSGYTCQTGTGECTR